VPECHLMPQDLRKILSFLTERCEEGFMGLADTLPGIYLPREQYSGNLRTIDPVHGEIHAGTYFTATHFVTVGTGTAATVLITPPAAGTGKYLHFNAEIITSNSGIVQWCENPVASGGTVVTSYNHLRSSSIVNPATIVHTPTVATIGTVLDTFIAAGTSTNQVVIGVSAGQRDEWLPKNDRTYLIKFVADNAATRVLIKCEYYYRDGPA